MFNVGQIVFDTKTDEEAQICAVIADGCVRELYIIQSFDTGEYRIVDSDRIIPYDKYYWDNRK